MIKASSDLVAVLNHPSLSYSSVASACEGILPMDCAVVPKSPRPQDQQEKHLARIDTDTPAVSKTSLLI